MKKQDASKQTKIGSQKSAPKTTTSAKGKQAIKVRADTETVKQTALVFKTNLSNEEVVELKHLETQVERNLGHDLEAIFEDGRKIYVEVKMVKSFNDSFKLTNNEFSSAQIYGKDYYVVVIINGEQPQIKFISNPIEKLHFEKVYERVL